MTATRDRRQWRSPSLTLYSATAQVRWKSLRCEHRKFSYKSSGERMLKIRPHLPKLLSNIKGMFFWNTCVSDTMYFIAHYCCPPLGPDMQCLPTPAGPQSVRRPSRGHISKTKQGPTYTAEHRGSWHRGFCCSIAAFMRQSPDAPGIWFQIKIK